VPWNAPGDRADSAKPPLGDKPTVDLLATITGGLMAVEGVLCTVFSVPFLMFGPVGLFGIAAGVAQVWVSLAVMRAIEGHEKAAAIASLVVGAGFAFMAFVLMAIASCASFVNCGSASEVPLFVATAIAAALNLLGAALLWKRARPQGRDKTGEKDR
jgi:hypothetical protein